MKNTPSIADEGLKNYLDRTAEEHKGSGYDRFVEMLTSELKYSKRQIAAEFGVHRETIYKWINVYEKEQAA